MKKILLTSFSILSFLSAFAQSGQKFASGGNSLSTGEFLGSTNNFPLIFKVNNIQKMSLTTTGQLQVNYLAGTGTRFLQTDAAGNLVSFPAGNATQVLYGNGVWGSLPVQPWVINGSDISYTAGNTSVAGFSTTNLTVNGSSTFNGSITVTGNKKIMGTLNVGGNSVFSGNIQNTSLAIPGGSHFLQSDANGNIVAFPNGTAQQVLYGNGLWGNLPVAPSTFWTSTQSNTINYNGSVGINKLNPNTAYALDIAGDVLVENNLHVNGGIIIGSQINGDNIAANYTVSAKEMATQRILVDRAVTAGLLSTDTISTTSPTISMLQSVDMRADLSTLGTINAKSALNVTGQATFVNSVDVGQQLTFKNASAGIGYVPQGNPIPTATLSPGNIVLSANTNVWGNLNVSGGANFDSLDAGKRLSFGGGQSGFGYVAPSGNNPGIIYTGKQAPPSTLGTACSLPYNSTGNTFGNPGSVVSYGPYFPAGTGIGAVITTFDGAHGIIESGAIFHSGPSPSLLLNYYCGSDVELCSNVNSTGGSNNAGGVVTVGKNLQIGPPAAFDIHTALNIKANDNNAIKIENATNKRIFNVDSTGNISINYGAQVFLGDLDNGLGSYSTLPNTTAFQGGPVLYGYWGGALASADNYISTSHPVATQTIALGWDRSGKVYIGPKRPTDPKFINAALSVDGIAVAKEIFVVDAGGAWADYVFEKDYKLKSLPELEKYINQNKHLPNVPSAKEIEANGQSVGKIQVTQMEKIEELTLYIIEMNKRMQKLEEENRKLADEMKSFKK
jgi:hypothetical protein